MPAVGDGVRADCESAAHSGPGIAQRGPGELRAERACLPSAVDVPTDELACLPVVSGFQTQMLFCTGWLGEPRATGRDLQRRDDP